MCVVFYIDIKRCVCVCVCVRERERERERLIFLKFGIKGFAFEFKIRQCSTVLPSTE